MDKFYITPLFTNGMPFMGHPKFYVDGPYDNKNDAEKAIPAYKQLTKVDYNVGIISVTVEK